MDKIDLDALVKKHIKAKPHYSKSMIARIVAREVIRQTLVLTGKKLESYVSELNKQSFEGWKDEEINGYKTATITIAGFAQMIVMDIEKLIV